MSKNRIKKQTTEPASTEEILLGKPSQVEVKEEKPKKLVGYNPITNEEVYE